MEGMNCFCRRQIPFMTTPLPPSDFDLRKRRLGNLGGLCFLRVIVPRYRIVEPLDQNIVDEPTVLFGAARDVFVSCRPVEIVANAVGRVGTCIPVAKGATI